MLRVGLVSLFLASFLLLSGASSEPPLSAPRAALDVSEIPANRGAAALWQDLKRLRTRASLIMITAHPDDEDGAMLAYESRGQGARVTLLTLNRGEGGANVMSPDYWDALGLVRTEELLAAGRYYGVDQYWTRACDYGFSKTLDEALTKWTRERVLGDVVRVVRATRPLVVTSVFVGGPSDGHGNHQLAGLMAKEVFQAAGDPARFPEQIQQGLRPWKPLKYYAHMPFFGSAQTHMSATVRVPAGQYDPLLGLSFTQLSHEGLGFQKSQNGGGFFPRAGSTTSDYHRFASRLAGSPESETDFFDGIDTSLMGIAQLADAGNRAFLESGLKEIAASVEEALAVFSAAHPEKCASALARGWQQTRALREKVQQSSLAADEKYDVLHELEAKATQFNDALVSSLGLALRATVAPDQKPNPLLELFMGDPDTFRLAIPGQRFRVRVSIANQTSERVHIERISLRAPAQSARQDNWWTVEHQTGAPDTIASGASTDWDFQVTAARSVPFTRPYFTRPSIEQPYYDIQQPQYLNLPSAPYPLSAWAELTYNGAGIQLGQAVQTAQRVNGLGLVYQPLVTGPAIAVEVSPRAGIVPLDAHSFDLSVRVHSNVKGPAKGEVVLALPAGWRAEPSTAPFATEQDGEDRSLTFRVTPGGLAEKGYRITAVAKYGGAEYREGYRVTGYPGLRPSFLYAPAEYKTSGVDVKVAPGLKVAYISGSGDDVPASLQQLGVRVTFLSAADLASADLSGFDVILLGVRTYAARPELSAYNQRLLEYVRNGGVMIVQYNTPEFDHNYGPYPYTMGEEPEEVTDEESKVTLLDPASPLFKWPNKITEADFRGWIEERGSKFMTNWDPHYRALLETHDPGQAPQRGGLLYAKYGKGIYVYNAYAFYRELPEGVPGAYRIMANLLSLAKNPER